MDLNCVDLKTGMYHEVPIDKVLYFYKGEKYQLLVRAERQCDLVWEMRGSVIAASNFLKQFGFTRVDTDIIANLQKVISKSKYRFFGKFEAYFPDGSTITVSRTAYDLYLKEVPLVQ